MRCNQCDSLYINGVFCHETGCYNSKMVFNKEENEWQTPEPEEVEDEEFLEDEALESEIFEDEDGLLVEDDPEKRYYDGYQTNLERFCDDDRD